MKLLSFVVGLSLLAALSSSDAGLADTGRRFPHSQITRAEWQTYLDEIKATPGVEVLKPEGRLETIAYFVAAEQSAYYFTTSGPAYPAVVVTRLYERDGKVRLQNFGYFAGSEEAFGVWFASFNNLGPEIEARLKAKP